MIKMHGPLIFYTALTLKGLASTKMAAAIVTLCSFRILSLLTIWNWLNVKKKFAWGFFFDLWGQEKQLLGCTIATSLSGAAIVTWEELMASLGKVGLLLSLKVFVVVGSSLKALLQAFKSLQQASAESKNGDGRDSCGTDLYVLCAEVAFKVKWSTTEIMKSTIENLFKMHWCCWIFSKHYCKVFKIIKKNDYFTKKFCFEEKKREKWAMFTCLLYIPLFQVNIRWE